MTQSTSLVFFMLSTPNERGEPRLSTEALKDMELFLTMFVMLLNLLMFLLLLWNFGSTLLAKRVLSSKLKLAVESFKASGSTSSSTPAGLKQAPSTALPAAAASASNRVVPLPIVDAHALESGWCTRVDAAGSPARQVTGQRSLEVSRGGAGVSEEKPCAQLTGHGRKAGSVCSAVGEPKAEVDEKPKLRDSIANLRRESIIAIKALATGHRKETSPSLASKEGEKKKSDQKKKKKTEGKHKKKGREDSATKSTSVQRKKKKKLKGGIEDSAAVEEKTDVAVATSEALHGTPIPTTQGGGRQRHGRGGHRRHRHHGSGSKSRARSRVRTVL
jgi:hypothetical protein